MSIGSQKSSQGIWGPQQGYLQDVYGQAKNLYQQAMPQSQNLASQAQQAWGQQLQADPTQSPYFQNAVMGAINPAIQQFTQQVLPNLRSQDIAGGTYGGSRRGIAEGLGANALAQNVFNTASQMGQQAYGQGLQARQGALGMAPGVMGLQFAPLQQYAGLIGGPTALSGSSGWSIGAGG